MKLTGLSVFIFLILSSCKQDLPDAGQAASFMENYFLKTGKGDFSNITTFYSDEMKAGESDEERMAKLKRLYDLTGEIKNYELKETKVTAELGEDAFVTLTYKVRHAHVTTTETYSVKKENDVFKIMSQNTENEVK